MAIYKIKSIQFHDYRAFYNGTNTQYLLNIDKKNVLIYGENGSGKSSIFNGLQDFICSSVEQVDFEKNIFSTTTNNGSVEIVFVDTTSTSTETTEKYDENAIVPTASFVESASEIPSFLSYRNFIKLHVQEDETRFVNFLIQEAFIDIKKDWETILNSTPTEDLQNIANFFLNEIEKESIRQELQNNNEETVTDNQIKEHVEDMCEEYLENLKNLIIKNITLFLKKIKSVNSFLIKFKQNIKLSPVIKKNDFLVLLNQLKRPNLSDATTLDANATIAKESVELLQNISIEIKFFHQSLDFKNAKNILNEARLSALASAIFLASIKTFPTQSEFKILFLDDIFIGLDMSNRIPLLEIIQEHFVDWQVFITTYDRYWFELAKDWFGKKAKGEWVNFEMYVGDSVIQNIDGTKYDIHVPQIIPTKGYMLKAKDYLAKKDYPACAIYLRKECERQLTSLLKPAHLRLISKQQQNSNCNTELKNLNGLILALEKFCKIEGINFQPFEPLKTYKDILFNPLAHNDIESPIFKRELQKSIAALKTLEKINSDTIFLKKGINLSFLLEKPTGEWINIRFQLREPLRIIKNELTTPISISVSKFCLCKFISSLNEANVMVSTPYTAVSVQELYEKEVQKFGLTPIPNILETIVYRNVKSLSNLLNNLSI